MGDLLHRPSVHSRSLRCWSPSQLKAGLHLAKAEVDLLIIPLPLECEGSQPQHAHAHKQTVQFSMRQSTNLKIQFYPLGGNGLLTAAPLFHPRANSNKSIFTQVSARSNLTAVLRAGSLQSETQIISLPVLRWNIIDPQQGNSMVPAALQVYKAAVAQD